MKAERVVLQTVIARMNVHLSLAIITWASLRSCNEGMRDCCCNSTKTWGSDGTLVGIDLPDGECNE